MAIRCGVPEPRQTTIGVDTAYNTNFRVPHWYDSPLPMQDPAADADEAELAVKKLYMPVIIFFA